jgi:hypothetical protein
MDIEDLIKALKASGDEPSVKVGEAIESMQAKLANYRAITTILVRREDNKVSLSAEELRQPMDVGVALINRNDGSLEVRVAENVPDTHEGLTLKMDGPTND